MNCKYCGEELEENAKFCTKCGAKVEPEEETAETQSSQVEPVIQQSTEPEQISEENAESAKVPEESTKSESEPEPAAETVEKDMGAKPEPEQKSQMTETEWKKKNYKRTEGVVGGFAIAFALLALVVAGIYIVFGLFVNEINLTFAFYCALAGVLLLMILSAAVRCTFTRVIRGIGYFVLLESTIVANLGIIYACVRHEYSIASMASLIPVIWLFAVLVWLLIAGVKAVALPGSKVLAFLCTLLTVLVTATAGFIIFSMISAYLSLMRITSVSLIEFFSGVSIYLVFAGLMFSEIFLGWRDCNDDAAKKLNK